MYGYFNNNIYNFKYIIIIKITKKVRIDIDGTRRKNKMYWLENTKTKISSKDTY